MGELPGWQQVAGASSQTALTPAALAAAQAPARPAQRQQGQRQLQAGWAARRWRQTFAQCAMMS